VVWAYAGAWLFVNDRVKLLAEHAFSADRPGLLTLKRRR
jgi:hypothetical protein